MADITYDTKEIRRYAKKFKKCADEINSQAAPNITKASNTASGNIEGETVQAMQQRFKDLSADAKKLVSQLTAMYNGLMRLADSLEEKDAAIAKLMKH